jgi:hypothetical protein
MLRRVTKHGIGPRPGTKNRTREVFEARCYQRTVSQVIGYSVSFRKGSRHHVRDVLSDVDAVVCDSFEEPSNV